MDRERSSENNHSAEPDDRGITRRRFLGLLGATIVASCKQKQKASTQAQLPTRNTPSVPAERTDDMPNTFQPAPLTEREHMRYADWQAANLTPSERREAERRVREFSGRLQALDAAIMQRWGIQRGLGDQRHYSIHELPPDPRFNPIRDIHDSLENLSLADQAQVRQMIAASGIFTAFQAISTDIFNLKDSDGFDQALQTFAKGNCEGIVLAAAANYARDHHRKMILSRDRFYYSARVKDYLPTGDDIYGQDIDPRNAPGMSEMFDQSKLTSLRDHPGWAGARRQRQFRELAANSAIAQLAKEADFTLAEYFSLIKATIHQQELNGRENSETDLAIASRLVTANREFAQKTLLDSQTNTVIVFHGSDHENWGGELRIPGHHIGRNDDSWSRIAVAAGVARGKIHRFGSDPERRGPSPLPGLYRAISRSHGKTFIAFDSHGLPEYLQVDDRAPEMKITPVDLARAFLDRVRATRDPSTLEQVTFFMEACYTYDFAHNVIQEMQRQWQSEQTPLCTFETLKLPTIIVPVQEGSYAAHNFKAFRVLTKQLVGIRSDGSIKGERILKNVQPISYREHDLTIFTSGSGKVTEIAQRGRSDNVRVA